MKFSSFRDPAGKVFFDEQHVVRVVAASARPQITEFLNTCASTEWQNKGSLIRAYTVDSHSELNGLANVVSEGDLVLRHPRIWFPSFPHEWPPEMLRAAAELTLEFANSLLEIGWGLKDATPLNILFQGTKPVFIDLLSFEKRLPGDPLWLPYRQFVNTFLLPLLVNKRCGVSLRTTYLADREGLDITQAKSYLSGKQRFDPAVLTLVTFPVMLSGLAERTHDLYSKERKVGPERARYILAQTFRRLRKQLARVTANPSRSKWSSYTDHNVSTVPEYMSSKQKFVEQTVRESAPGSVLDIGCNTGYFSFFAARHGAKVVAIDHDPAVVGRVWREADAEGLDVLPLVVDISKPSPRIGWRNAEVPSFLDRAVGRFDLVMMLAVLHHLMVRDRIPLGDILGLAADLTTDALIIEFVPPADPMFRKIARGRDLLYSDLNISVFESAAREFFEIVASEKVSDSGRTVYFLRKHGGQRCDHRKTDSVRENHTKNHGGRLDA